MQAQCSLENSESDVEEHQEKLALDLRLSSTRAASMYVSLCVILAYLCNKIYVLGNAMLNVVEHLGGINAGK